MSKQSFSEKNSKFRFPPLSSMTLFRQDMGKCRFFLLDLLRFELGLLQKMTHCRSQTQCDISLICCLLFLFSIQHHNKSNTQFIKRRVKCVVFQLLYFVYSRGKTHFGNVVKISLCRLEVLLGGQKALRQKNIGPS